MSKNYIKIPALAGKNMFLLENVAPVIYSTLSVCVGCFELFFLTMLFYQKTQRNTLFTWENIFWNEVLLWNSKKWNESSSFPSTYAYIFFVNTLCNHFLLCYKAGKAWWFFTKWFELSFPIDSHCVLLKTFCFGGRGVLVSYFKFLVVIKKT